MKCLDFKGQELHLGDWVIRPVGGGSSSPMLVYSHIEEEPHTKKGAYNTQGWAFWIVTHNGNGWGRKGKAENHMTMIKVPESEVPPHMVEAYYKQK